jgi:bacterioferritin-associated ferredoxin
MEIIQICPGCGLPAVAVNAEAVKYNVIGSLQHLINLKIKWSICVNPSCDRSYFSKTSSLSTADLNVSLFFKDKSDNVPICYCSGLTRGEIKSAVKNGCKSIDDVQNYTGKDITGMCKERNPLGKCCRKVFLKTISDAMNND